MVDVSFLKTNQKDIFFFKSKLAIKLRYEKKHQQKKKRL
jgi:hypothetical protein